MERYSKILTKQKREIVLLRGRGCVYKKCAFCDYHLREKELHKGIRETNIDEICKNFDEANFLFGIKGQTKDSMEKDIELGLQHFDRICINMMCTNSTPIKPDIKVIADFMKYIYPKYIDNERVDILIDKTDFGVGD